VTPATARARASAEVALQATALGLPVDQHASLAEAVACARAAAGPRPVVVAGSLYLVGEARALLAGDRP
jgi:dihydrofolate synthase/folylpolyglutamate synthase